MVLPRGLFIMDNPYVANLGPKSAHAAALASCPQCLVHWTTPTLN
jgi:hypothetical protein